MKRKVLVISAILLWLCPAGNDSLMAGDISLTPPGQAGIDLVDAMRNRRSVREFTGRAIDPGDLSAILWAAYGQTRPDGRRTIPTPWNRRMIQVYVLDASGCYRYEGDKNLLKSIGSGDSRNSITAFASSWAGKAPVILIITVDLDQGPFHAGSEEKIHNATACAGACAQNVYLMANARGMGTCLLAGFDRDRVRQVLGLKKTEQPLFIMPLGYVK